MIANAIVRRPTFTLMGVTADGGCSTCCDSDDTARDTTPGGLGNVPTTLDEIASSVADSHERSALKRRFPGRMRLDSRSMDSLPLRVIAFMPSCAATR